MGVSRSSNTLHEMLATVENDICRFLTKESTERRTHSVTAALSDWGSNYPKSAKLLCQAQFHPFVGRPAARFWCSSYLNLKVRNRGRASSNSRTAECNSSTKSLSVNAHDNLNFKLRWVVPSCVSRCARHAPPPSPRKHLLLASLVAPRSLCKNFVLT